MYYMETSTLYGLNDDARQFYLGETWLLAIQITVES